MKRVLLDYRGVINDVVDIGREFEIYNGPDSAIRWVLCPHDDVTNHWHFSDGHWLKPEEKLDSDQNMKRKVAYGTIEDQLGMLYWDSKNGNLENGDWMTHISNVKETIISKTEYESDSSNFEGKKELKLHSQADPAWKYLPQELDVQPDFN